MNCKKCGKELDREGKYCLKCVDEQRKEVAKRHYDTHREEILRKGKINEKRYNRKCIDCGKEVCRDSLRCRECASKTRHRKERKIDKTGYVQIQMPGHPFADHKGYVREHRLVVEQKIGRYLRPEEVVHHIDGDKQNNKIGNLMLFSTHRKHLQFHTRIIQYGYTGPIMREIANRWEEIK